MAENSPESHQVKQISWQQMHDGLFWPRYAPLLPGQPADDSALYRPYEIGCAHAVQGDPALPGDPAGTAPCAKHAQPTPPR